MTLLSAVPPRGPFKVLPEDITSDLLSIETTTLVIGRLRDKARNGEEDLIRKNFDCILTMLASCGAVPNVAHGDGHHAFCSKTITMMWLRT